MSPVSITQWHAKMTAQSELGPMTTKLALAGEVLRQATPLTPCLTGSCASPAPNPPNQLDYHHLSLQHGWMAIGTQTRQASATKGPHAGSA
jgi:hypothetical protein